MVGDAFNVGSLLALAPPGGYDFVYVDISGSRDLPGLMKLIGSLESALRPRTIVVKSIHLKRLLIKGRLWMDDDRCFVGAELEGSKLRKNAEQQQQQQQQQKRGAAASYRTFVPTDAWQYVDDDQIVPSGCQISMDVSTGTKKCRLLQKK